MRDRALYASKIVQFERGIDESNIAAQRAYTKSQISVNNIRSQALLDHSEDFKEMLMAEGAIEAGAAERGIRGKSVQRLRVANLQKMGFANSMRAKALTQTHYRYKQHVADVQMQLKSNQNQQFSKVAIQPIPDLTPPPLVMQNPNQILFMGLAGAAFDGVGSYYENKAGNIYD